MAGERSIAVIGAGIVGVSAALWLARDGHEVLLIDKTGPGEGTSYGNAGVLASCSVVPVTVPGLLRKAPAMLLDPESPLFLRWSYLPKLAPWLARYLSHCRPSENRRIAAALAPLTGNSLDEHQALAAGTGAEKWIAPSDYLFVYRDRTAYEADSFVWLLRREMGYQWDELEGSALTNYDPAFGDATGFGARLTDHGHITDPGRYVKELARHLEALGGRNIVADVRDIVIEDDRLVGLETSNGRIDCDRAVVTAGAWSGPLASKLGLKVPLESERGYHIDLEGPSVVPRSPSMIAAGKFVATPMVGRLRCAGIVEFAGLAAPPNPKPFELLAKQARMVFPGLAWEAMRKWMGHRPAPADSIPIIGFAPGRSDVLMGFGHHHVGLTSGPKTGRLIADLVAERRPNFDLAPYRPDRFAT